MPITRDHATILAEIRNPPTAARAPARWTEDFRQKVLATAQTPERCNIPMVSPLPAQRTVGKNAEDLPGPCKRVRIETPPAASTRSDSTVVASPTEPATFIAARKRQVDLLNAGAVLSKSKQAWPAATPKTRELFEARHPAYRTYSDGYMQTQLRLLFLLDINPDDRQERFEEECFRRALAPTTAATYWIAFVGVDKIINGVLTTPATSRVTHELEKRAAEFPVKFPHALTMEQLCDFKQRFRDSASALVALVVASWTLGQRFGDFIQLAVNDIMYDCQELRITFRRGKTVSVTSPYTLPLDRRNPAADALLEVARSARERGWLYLIGPDISAASRKWVQTRVSAMLSIVDTQLEIRSIRRGGLQRMAAIGHKLDKIREFSRHSSEAMLLRYLNWGEKAEHHLQQLRPVTLDMALR